jgi:anti-sigma B factor antagonist
MNIERQNGTLSIKGIRELTSASASAFREALNATDRCTLSAIELDISKVAFLDSSGLGALASLYKAASEHQLAAAPALRLLDPQPPVQQMLELARMHHLFEIVLRTEDEAEPTLAGSPLTAPSIMAVPAT